MKHTLNIRDEDFKNMTYLHNQNEVEETKPKPMKTALISQNFFSCFSSETIINIINSRIYGSLFLRLCSWELTLIITFRPPFLEKCGKRKKSRAN